MNCDAMVCYMISSAQPCVTPNGKIKSENAISSFKHMIPNARILRLLAINILMIHYEMSILNNSK